MNNNKKVNLLAPVGSMESMIAAINSGCDEIYLGGKNFNARQNASNFTNNELAYIIDYCHLKGVKVNLTLNILYKESEIKPVLDFVSEIYSYGVDSVIIQDIGIFNLIKNNFKNLNIHASTQMTIHNLEGVLFLQSIGFDRVVLSRELSLSEIEEITKGTSIEIEAFVHGAICVSYSGRCLMSSIIGERSGNRGRCAQPCRMEYKLIKNNEVLVNDYLLSPKDTSTLPIIDKIINSGIDTFKIEGRMKSPEYVGAVTSAYRKYIDTASAGKFDKIDPEDLSDIAQIFNRGGSFITGYYENWAGKNMISPSPKSSGLNIGVVEGYNRKSQKCDIKLFSSLMTGDGIEIWTKTKPHTGTNISKVASKGDIISIFINGNITKGDLVFRSFDKALDNKLKNFYHKNTRRQEVLAYINCRIGEPLSIKLKINDIEVTAFGNIVESAIKSSLTEDKLILNLSKTGNSSFYLTFENIEIDENVYIPVSSINTLRRTAIGMLEEKLISSYRRDKIDILYKPKIEINKNQYLTALVQNKEQFDACINSSVLTRIYVELSENTMKNLEYFIEKSQDKNIEIFVALFGILRNPSKQRFYEMLTTLENSDIDGYLLRNYMNLKTNKKIALDYALNIFNNSAINTVLEYFDSVCLSPELNLSEILALSSKNTEVLVYGKLPLMTTHQCPIGLYASGKNSGMFCSLKNTDDVYYLRDRKNIDFPVKPDCFNCLATIINNNPIFVLNKYLEITRLQNQFLRINFLDESTEEIQNILLYYKKTLIDKESFDIRNSVFKNLKYTNGHFFRGVL